MGPVEYFSVRSVLGRPGRASHDLKLAARKAHFQRYFPHKLLLTYLKHSKTDGNNSRDGVSEVLFLQNADPSPVFVNEHDDKTGYRAQRHADHEQSMQEKPVVGAKDLSIRKQEFHVSFGK